MRSFANLVMNEWLKLYKKRSFMIAYAIMGLLAVGSAILIWKYSPGELPTVTDFMSLLLSGNGLGTFYTIIALIFTAGVVSQEHQLGSVKFLLIRPHSRFKILASKYATVLLYLLTLMLFTAAAAAVMGWVMFGSGGEQTWGDMLRTAGYHLLYTAIYATLMFMFGVLTRSTGATIGIGLCLTMLESLDSVIVLLLSKYQFAKYILFLNTNLEVYSSGEAPIQGMTIGFSTAVIAVYMLIALGISFTVFKKRDVA